MTATATLHVGDVLVGCLHVGCLHVSDTHESRRPHSRPAVGCPPGHNSRGYRGECAAGPPARAGFAADRGAFKREGAFEEERRAQWWSQACHGGGCQLRPAARDDPADHRAELALSRGLDSPGADAHAAVPHAAHPAHRALRRRGLKVGHAGLASGLRALPARLQPDWPRGRRRQLSAQVPHQPADRALPRAADEPRARALLPRHALLPRRHAAQQGPRPPRPARGRRHPPVLRHARR